MGYLNTANAAPADPPALTSTQVGAAPTQAQFNALQADVAALRTTLLAVTDAMQARRQV